MKKILALTLLLLTTVGVFAQEKTIKQEEFETIYRNSFDAFGINSRRETRIQQTTTEFIPQTNSPNNLPVLSAPKTFNKTVTEFIPSVGFHSISEFNSSSSSLNTKTERISCNGKIYTRKDDGNWVDGDFFLIASNAKPATKIVTEIESKAIIDKIEYKYLGNEKLENQTTAVYAKIELGRRIYSKDNSEISSQMTTKYWFSENGALLKTESINLSRSKNSVINSTLVTTYEKDPNIKIEAPILNQ